MIHPLTLVRLGLAVMGGLFLDLASPGLGFWPLACIGQILILSALWQQPWWLGGISGALSGAAFWFPHLEWLTLYLGPVPWAALAGVMTVWFTVMGACIAGSTRVFSRWSRLRALPGAVVTAQILTVTGVWVLRESVQSSWPYGGFAWGRIALTQADSPFADSVGWIGITGLSAGMTALAAATVAAIFAAVQRRGRSPVVAPLACALVLGCALVLPPAPIDGSDSQETVRVAGIQGNAKAGIFDDRESGDVIQSHLDATEAYLAETPEDARASVIVWPENSAEFDVRTSSNNRARVQALARSADATLILGSVLEDASGSGRAREAPKYYNASLTVTPNGEFGERFDKRYPVPFAEYMPNRAFFRAFAPELVDLVQLDYSPGERPSRFDLGGIHAGIAICFDITFDRHARDLVANDARVVFAQTNNADFGNTDQSAQQLAITRLQAISMGRALVNVSTVGTSEILGPDGSTLDGIPAFTAGAIVADVPLIDAHTPATRWGAAIAGTVMGLGVAGLVSACLGAIATRRGARRAVSQAPRASVAP